MQNYMDELFQLMKSDLPDEQIAEQLENYHEKELHCHVCPLWFCSG